MAHAAATFLDVLAERVQAAGRYNSLVEAAPVAVLWPDEARQWETLVPRLRQRLPLLTLGTYEPESLTGPPGWLRCMVARSLVQPALSEGLPVLYLPACGAAVLRMEAEGPEGAELLVELRHRGALWLQPNGRDWTVRAFVERGEADGGLGVAVRDDAATEAALLEALPYVAELTVARLQENAPWRASDFAALAPPVPAAAELSLSALIAQGEGQTLELKSTGRWNIHAGRPDAKMEWEVYKTVGAFLNTVGGTLLIGVEDDGTVRGIEEDYQAWQKPAERNRDKYEQWLRELLKNAYGAGFAHLIRIAFERVDERWVCRVTVRPAPRPAYTDYAKEKDVGALYVRMGNRTEPLPLPAAVEYVLDHWPDFRRR